MTIDIPDERMKAAKISANELLLDLAVYLYDKERLSIGQARKLVGLDLITFQKELAARNVFIKYDLNDLNTDVKNMNLTS